MHNLMKLSDCLTELCCLLTLCIYNVLDVDAGYTVDDFVNAPAYGGVAAAMDVQAGENEHDSTCECSFCVYL